MFIRTTAVNKLRALTKFVKGVQGGTSASKTYSILAVEIDYAIKNPNTETSVVAESIPHLKRGAMRDFAKIMKQTNRWSDSNWNATDFRYRFSNGSFIEFFSADNDAKLRGARRDRLYMNEANNMTFHAYTELASRTKQSVFLDWNPTSAFWFHEELMGDDDVDFIILSYKDNEGCPESALNFINKAKEKAQTSEYWANWYRVYGLGEIGNLEGTVFNNWQQVDSIDRTKAKFIGLGLDFGYTNDPTALIAVFMQDGELWLEELLYQTGLTNQDIGNKLKDLSINRSWEIIADSAEPKSIEELRRMGFNISAVSKGADSIANSIDILQRYRMNVTKISTNLIKELRSYKWKKDKSGKALNEPEDYLNHLCDALRYVALKKIGAKNSGRYMIV